MDELRTHLPVGTPERTNLDAEPRYIECRLGSEPIPMEDNSVDGLLCQHVIEHLDCHTAAEVLKDCRRVLKPGGLMIASVPDAEYFLRVYARDTRATASELFGEPISEAWHEKFFDYALWHEQHVQILTHASLRCLFLRAGWPMERLSNYWRWSARDAPGESAYDLMAPELNRQKFSAWCYATKE